MRKVNYYVFKENDDTIDVIMEDGGVATSYIPDGSWQTDYYFDKINKDTTMENLWGKLSEGLMQHKIWEDTPTEDEMILDMVNWLYISTEPVEFVRNDMGEMTDDMLSFVIRMFVDPIVEEKPSLLEFVKELVSHITMSVFGTNFKLLVCEDKVNVGGRIYLQVDYEAPCTKTNNLESWKGRKWYLSEFMTDDEIVKTAYCAFQSAVTHEIMEGFKFDNVIVFNPHINFRELLKVSHLEIKRN
jgi:hypothetical protein